MSPGLNLAHLTACGAHQTGHFLLSSGLHTGDYLQCALYLAQPQRAAAAGTMLAEAITSLGLRPELVVSPALGGLIIGHETARALGVGFIFTERSGSEMVLRRGFSVSRRQPVVVVEDVVTTGRSTREVVAVLQEAEATVLGVASLINRSRTASPAGQERREVPGREHERGEGGAAIPFAPMPYCFLLEVDLPTWQATDCPLCREGIPMQKPGSRPVSEPAP